MSLPRDAEFLPEHQGETVPEAAECSPGVKSCNTPLHTRQEEELETGGVDTVVWGLGVEWQDADSFEALLAILQDGKDRAKEAHDVVPVIVNGLTFGIAPGGKGTGGGKGTFYSFKLSHEGLTFMLTKSPKPHEQTPNVMVDAGSTLLMAYGFNAVWAEVRRIVESMGGRLVWDKLSRLDLCVDIPKVSVKAVCDAVYQNSFVARARNHTFYRCGRKWTGVCVGVGDLVLRMYDKAHEVRHAKPNPAKEFILMHKRWGCNPGEAVRVEFQLRRRVLKELGIQSTEDFLDNAGSIVAYLTGDWFRLTEEIPDAENRHQDRAESSELWKEVTRRFNDWTGKAKHAIVRAKRTFCKDPILLVKQAGGCIMGAVIDLLHVPEMTPCEFRPYAHQVVDYYIDAMSEQQFLKRFNQKAFPRLISWPGMSFQQTGAS